MTARSRRRADARRRELQGGFWARLASWKRVAAIMITAFVIGSIGAGSLVAYAEVTMPPIATLGTQTGSITIEDSTGHVIATVGRSGVVSTPVALSEISPLLIKATIDTEDRYFYSEGALDPVRIVKAAFVDAASGSAAQGASTITQELAKMVYFGYEAPKSPMRKIREALLANEISHTYTKNEILDKYLNIVFYGENSYGIQAAAERFFGVNASQLTLQEASLLAGLPQAPSYYDPFVNPQAAWERQHVVLEGMVRAGDITQQQADAIDPLVGGYTPTAADKALQAAHQQAMLELLRNGHPPTVDPGPAPHFVQFVENELSQYFANDPSALQGNLTVITTLNLALQERADAIIHKEVYGPYPIGHGINNAAMLMMNPKNGAIEVMVGSANYADTSIDGEFNVTTGLRQPGSTFKPFVYETGFMNGSLTPNTILNDTYQQSLLEGGVKDWDRKFEGNIPAWECLVHSRNVCTEQAMGIAGIDNVIAFAHSAGINTPIAHNLSSAIGTSAVHMLNMTAAYAPFANGGYVVKPFAILKVIAQNGTVLINNSVSPDYGSIMTPYQAWTIDHILIKYPAYWGLHLRYQTAGKSGTTDNYADSWYYSFTPSWIISTWAGHTSATDPGELPTNGIYGSTQAQYTIVPFVNSLPKPAEFSPTPPSGTLCPSCTPAPSPSGTPSSSTTPTPSTTPYIQPTPASSPSGGIQPTPIASPSDGILPTPSPSPSQPGGIIIPPGG